MQHEPDHTHAIPVVRELTTTELRTELAKERARCRQLEQRAAAFEAALKHSYTFTRPLRKREGH